MSKRKNHSPEFKAKDALVALEGERTVAELASQFGVPTTMILSWKRAHLEGVFGVFKRGRKPPDQVGYCLEASEVAMGDDAEQNTSHFKFLLGVRSQNRH